MHCGCTTAPLGPKLQLLECSPHLLVVAYCRVNCCMTSLHTMLGVLSRLPAMRVGCTRWSTVLPRYARPLAVQGVNLLHVHAHPCLAQDMQPGFYAAEAGGFDETGLKSDVVAHIQTAGFERPSFIQAKVRCGGEPSCCLTMWCRAWRRFSRGMML